MVNGVAVHADLGEEVELLEFPIFLFEVGEGLRDHPFDFRLFVSICEIKTKDFFC